MLEKSPTMTTPIVKHPHFDGMAEYCNAILLGQAADIPKLDSHTKIYLHKLAAIACSLPDQAQKNPWKNISNKSGAYEKEPPRYPRTSLQQWLKPRPYTQNCHKLAGRD